MPPRLKLRLGAKSDEHDAEPSATSSSTQPQMPTLPAHPSASLIPASRPPNQSSYFKFNALPRKLRDRVYMYYLALEGQRTVKIATAGIETRHPDRTYNELFWAIRVQPAIPIPSLLVSRRFYREGLSAFLNAGTVVLQLYGSAARKHILDSPHLPPRRIVERVTQFVRYVQRCTVRVDITNLQDLARNEHSPVGATTASVTMLKGRLFTALTCMSSLVSLKLEIFRTEASIERFAVDIAPLAELRTLQGLKSVMIVFTDHLGNEKLVQDWQRNVSLRTNLRGVSITEEVSGSTRDCPQTECESALLSSYQEGGVISGEKDDE